MHGFSAEFGEHDPKDVAAPSESQLSQDVVHVILDGRQGDVQVLSDLLVGETLADEPGDLPFADGQGPLRVRLRARANTAARGELLQGDGGHTGRAGRLPARLPVGPRRRAG
jgi:hypothetical protein